MLKIINYLVTLTLLTITSNTKLHAESTSKLTVIIDGITNQKGEICLGLYGSSKGFPMNTKNVLQSACIKPTNNTLTYDFVSLKPGNYAVAVIDDQNGDHKLNTDFFGIPREGFGISRNPKVSVLTGTPKFHNASVFVYRHQTIKILMKYELDI